FNCAQSVLWALSDYTGLDDAALKAVSAGFGGGLRCGEACGAVTGAVMALGLATVKDGIGTKTAPIADKTRKLVDEFKAKFDSVRCDELLEAADGHEKCDEFISYCAQLAAAIIDEDEEK
ncbi:MAG: C_GCAxxG_C_C family protein, partial [Clostridia bacterium]|nr:C_GCAxxG_C_C family protein [Clostridia bacterium]